jgi:hypothetical protein
MILNPKGVDCNYHYADRRDAEAVSDFGDLAHLAMKLSAKRLEGRKLTVLTRHGEVQIKLVLEKPAGDKQIVAYEIRMGSGNEAYYIGGAFSMLPEFDLHTWMLPRYPEHVFPLEGVNQPATRETIIDLFREVVKSAQLYLADPRSLLTHSNDPVMMSFSDYQGLVSVQN